MRNGVADVCVGRLAVFFSLHTCQDGLAWAGFGILVCNVLAVG